MSKGNPIPTKARETVRKRDQGRCLRCGSARGSDLHHRRRRRESAGHDPHCACNLVTLCRTCHSWIHKHPALAREANLIVSAYITTPWDLPVDSVYGAAFLGCDGSATID